MYNGATMEPISFAAGLFTMFIVNLAAAATTHAATREYKIHTNNDIDAAAEDMKIGLGIKMDTDDDNDGVNDSDEALVGTDPLLNETTPGTPDGDLDFDNDGWQDLLVANGYITADNATDL